MSTTASAPEHALPSAGTLAQRIALAVSTFLLGCCLVGFAGFSHIEAVHNAAHDTRHSAAFPCH
ncbi:MULTISPECIES: CbtB domain-containing protein [Pseudomonas]|uniref:CbtB domain-containing protein n=1 Tax=Pseudomonas TaxID=286 RepID=UPI00257F9229|nr:MULTISPECIES: CbtB-domain containing protein [Pseudomonas]